MTAVRQFLVFTLPLASVVLPFATPSAAADLPENTMITNRANEIPVYSLESVSISNDQTQIIEANGRKMFKVSGAVEVTAKVEGNLCGSSASDVFISERFQTEKEFQISLGYKYSSNPFGDRPEICSTTSAPRTVRFAFKVSGIAVDEAFERTFNVSLGFSNDQVSKIVVKVEDRTGIKASIVNPNP